MDLFWQSCGRKGFCLSNFIFFNLFNCLIITWFIVALCTSWQADPWIVFGLVRLICECFKICISVLKFEHFGTNAFSIVNIGVHSSVPNFRSATRDPLNESSSNCLSLVKIFLVWSPILFFDKMRLYWKARFKRKKKVRGINPFVTCKGSLPLIPAIQNPR